MRLRSLGYILSLVIVLLVVNTTLLKHHPVAVIEDDLGQTKSSSTDPYTPIENYFKFKAERRQKGHAKLEAPELYAIVERERRTSNDRTAPEYPANHKMLAIQKAKSAKSHTKSKHFLFIERGPNNVAGRTRALLVLPGDKTNQTMLAGSATGGIWKTENGGQSWKEMTIDFPNLGTNTLAMSKADPQVIYAGTGEHFTRSVDGSGLFKSLDEGVSWTQIVRDGDYDAFKNVSRIIVHPNDPDIVIAATRNSVYADSLRAAIYKSTDGGITWEQKLFSTKDRYDDLAFNHSNFNTIYAAVEEKGVLKSIDQGETWIEKSDGLNISGRLEIATSTLDTNYIWGLAEGGGSGSGSDVYLSINGGDSWKLVLEEDGDPIDFLNNQGFYDNVVEPHPFQKDAVYIGGINLFKLDVFQRDVLDVTYKIRDEGAFDFLDFINGTLIGGGILEGNLPTSEVVSVQLRFGQGGQKAHRFTVNGAGAGVSKFGYEYLDVVDFPFQAWDITNNRQLMVSFRDQQEDGEWTLKERSLNAANTQQDSREYIFIHDVAYADTANIDIAQDGGHEFRQLYFMWPVLRTGRQYDPLVQDPASFSIEAIQTIAQASRATAISDAYDQFNGNNGYSADEASKNEGHHPDQHSVQFIVTDSANQIFKLLTTNDGGIYISNASSDPGSSDNAFTYLGFGYNTSQFYGADKMPGEYRFIGGMQDNGTWIAPQGTIADAETNYEFALGGDGFEVIWNNRNPKEILGSIQFNQFRRSTDGGVTWDNATIGLDDIGQGKAPFISRLANSRAQPERVFAVGSTGVWVSETFGEEWTKTQIVNMWSFYNSTEIEVSPSNPEIIWAGGALDENERFFVSTDGGQSFNKSSFYQNVEMGRSSGIGLHPEEDSTAYALFSFSGRPKILRTTDLGVSWEDISGFEGNDGSSDRGFPDVAIRSLLVFPNETSRIWVGSEIGIIESENNGESWHLLDSRLPAVNVYDMKIQDDEVVAATYGRGIWSVHVDDLDINYIFPPSVTAVSVDPEGSLGLEIITTNEFDSLQMLIDNQYLKSINQIILTGESSFNISNFQIEDGVYNFAVIGYRDGEAYRSFNFKSSFFNPLPPTEVYFNDFSVDSLLDDFIGDGFSIRIEEGFLDPAIHSPHNYVDRKEIVYQLKKPIIVTEKQSFIYKDVVIVEPGESNAPFGSQNFFDYVVAEGSKDGLHWLPLADGYDSSADPSWRLAFNNEGKGSAAIFVSHEIDLKDTFNDGEVIFIRYRLFADPFVTGWGWAIDDVEVKKITSTPVIDPTFSALRIFPNPVSDYLNVELPELGASKRITISDIQGRHLAKIELEHGQSIIRIPVYDYKEGIYFVEVYDDNRLIASEKIVIVK